MKGRFEAPKPQRSGAKTALTVVLVIVAVLALLVVGVIIYYNRMISKVNHAQGFSRPDYSNVETSAETTEPETTVETTTEATTEATTEPHVASPDDYVNFLVVGQAARDGEEERFADTMMLFTLNTYEKTLTMTSILRDSFTQMPDYKGHHGGRIKLTTIYHLGYIYGNGVAGSMEMMDLALYNNFGIEVDHNFEIDFAGFVDVINMLGGIDVELTEAECEWLNGYIEAEQMIEDKYTLTPGMNHLEGYCALSYARLRKAAGDNESDIKRTSRQQNVVNILMQKIRNMSLPELQNLANQVLPLITTSMTSSEITGMLATVLPMLPELKLSSAGTCPADYWGDMVEIYGDGVKHSVLRFDEKATKQTMRAITKGETE